nr:MAG TPA: hypothetical protein [Caudoviricetes sp.]
MNKAKIKEAVTNLEGLSYHDWQKVKAGIDQHFHAKEIKHKRELTLDSCETIVDSILREFGIEWERTTL